MYVWLDVWGVMYGMISRVCETIHTQACWLVIKERDTCNVISRYVSQYISTGYMSQALSQVCDSTHPGLLSCEMSVWLYVWGDMCDMISSVCEPVHTQDCVREKGKRRGRWARSVCMFERSLVECMWHWETWRKCHQMTNLFSSCHVQMNAPTFTIPFMNASGADCWMNHWAAEWSTKKRICHCIQVPTSSCTYTACNTLLHTDHSVDICCLDEAHLDTKTVLHIHSSSHLTLCVILHPCWWMPMHTHLVASWFLLASALTVQKKKNI